MRSRNRYLQCSAVGSLALAKRFRHGAEAVYSLLVSVLIVFLTFDFDRGRVGAGAGVHEAAGGRR